MNDKKPKMAKPVDTGEDKKKLPKRFTLPKGAEPTPTNVKRAIDWNEKWRNYHLALNMYYEGEHEIQKRTKPESVKNNKIVVNHAEYITDLFVGYLVGQPIEYETDDSDKEYDIEPVLEEFREQTIEDLDSDLATDLSIYGRAYEWVYADEDNNVRSAKIEPINGCVVYDDTMRHDPIFAVVYDRVEENQKGEKKYYGVKVATERVIIDFDEDLVAGERVEHFFDAVPMFEYANTSKYNGDFEKVISLIDAYNLLQSDRVNDKEQLVEAILVIYGFDLTDEVLKHLKTNRIMTAPPKTEGTMAEYLVKMLNEGEVDILRAVIENDIHKISKTPNMSDENFIGNASGVALKYKILPFEWRSNTKQRKMTKGLRRRFKLYQNYLKANSDLREVVPVHKIKVVFKRNLPQNDFEASQMINNLTDTVSRKTLLGQLSFIRDADKEMEERDSEAKDRMTEFGNNFGSNEPNIANNDNEPNGVQTPKSE